MKFNEQILVALGLGAKKNWHIFLALIAGIIVGITFPYESAHPWVQNLFVITGEVFIRLIQMVIIPLVISTIIVGISSLGDSRQLGKMGVKMLGYYSIITIMAVIIGASLALGIGPGKNIQGDIDPAKATKIRTQVESIQKSEDDLTQLYLGMIPKNPIESLAQNKMPAILIFTLIFACALASVGEMNRPIVSFFESLFAATMKVTDWIMIIAPPGIFALTVHTVANSGIKVFSSMSLYVFTIILGLLIQLFIVYPLMLKLFSKVKATSLYKAINEAILVAFGTASSSATLPVTIRCCEARAGISSKVSSFVLPLGATMNMDGTALYQTVAVIFIAQAYDIVLTPMIILQICVFAIIASSSSAGIPSAGLITMALILNILGLKTEQIGAAFVYIVALDRFIDMFRTVNNITSDTVVASCIAAGEGELDYKLLGNQEEWKEVI